MLYGTIDAAVKCTARDVPYIVVVDLPAIGSALTILSIVKTRYPDHQLNYHASLGASYLPSEPRTWYFDAPDNMESRLAN